MERMNKIQVGHFCLAGEYYDPVADAIIAELSLTVTDEIKKIPVYEAPQLQVIEGGRK